MADVKRCWEVMHPESLPEPKSNPQAVAEFIQSQKRQSMDAPRSHLLSLGWRFEHKQDVHFVRFRYISPQGKIYYSLITACKGLEAKDVPVSNGVLCSASCNQALVPKPEAVEHEKKKRMKVLTKVEAKSCTEAVITCRDLEAKTVPVSDIVLCQASVNDQVAMPKLETRKHGKKNPLKCLGFVKVEAELCLEAVIEYSSYEFKNGRIIELAGNPNVDLKTLRLKARKHLAAKGWKIWNVEKKKGKLELRYKSPGGKVYLSLQTACKAYIEDSNELSMPSTSGSSTDSNITSEKSSPANLSTQKARKWKKLNRCLKGGKASSGGLSKLPVLVSSKERKPQTILPWLIDNNIILPRERVKYMNKRDGKVMASGKVTREGIKCNCCCEVFNMTGFERHAGSTNHRPSAHIFLSDGRSLFECQAEALKKTKTQMPALRPSKRLKKEEPVSDGSDSVCSVCQEGGELLCCDRCPAVYHLECIGLEDVPEGKWFCLGCQCAICSEGEVCEESKAVRCEQCERKCHVMCLAEREQTIEGISHHDLWFCSSHCYEVFVHLHKLIGRSNPTGIPGLTWTILRLTDDQDYESNRPDGEDRTEHHSKLWLAINVLHECFEPFIDPYTKREIIPDIIFSRRSDLKRLDFKGFYTMLLEKEDELITVATIRIFGMLAEMPLIGTCFRHRNQGMCRILVTELEKMLAGLGVEILVLPAAPQLLNTWTNSFSFTRVSNGERLNLLHYPFLDFQGTTLCQKYLPVATNEAVHETNGEGN